MASLSQYSVMSLPYSFRNKIINGAMLIDQRRSGNVGTFTNTSGWALDKWAVATRVASVSIIRSTDAPPGFSNSLSVLNNTVVIPGNSPNMYCRIIQRIEDILTGDMMYGTDRAEPVTISFWVKSSETGFYPIVWKYNIDESQDYAEYKTRYYVDSPNTWEKKTITIPGNTLYKNRTGRNSIADCGAILEFVLASGNNFNTSVSEPAVWTVADTLGYNGQAYITREIGITFNITGVQVETRGTATPFEWRPYGLEFLMCQRYYNQPMAYYEIASQSGAVYQTYTFPIPMPYSPFAKAFTTDLLYPEQTVDIKTPYHVRVKIDSASNYTNRLSSLDADI